MTILITTYQLGLHLPGLPEQQEIAPARSTTLQRALRGTSHIPGDQGRSVRLQTEHRCREQVVSTREKQGKLNI